MQRLHRRSTSSSESRGILRSTTDAPRDTMSISRLENVGHMFALRLQLQRVRPQTTAGAKALQMP